MRITVEIECPGCGDVKPYDFLGCELRKMIDVYCSECGLEHTVVVTPVTRKAKRAYAQYVQQLRERRVAT